MLVVFFLHVENVVVMRGVTGHTCTEPDEGVSFITGSIQIELLLNCTGNIQIKLLPSCTGSIQIKQLLKPQCSNSKLHI